MKKKVKLCLMMLLLSVVCISGVSSNAKGVRPKIARKTVWMYGKDSYVSAYDFYAEEKDVVAPDTFISIKSSNKNVLEVASQDKKYNNFAFKAKKTGKSKITIKYKYKGKVYKETATVKVKKFSNPIKKATLNGKDITKKLKKGYYENYKYNKGKIKVNLKLKKGWKIKMVTYTYPSYEYIKNGQSVSIPKKQYTRVRYILVNKYNEELGINFHFQRK